MNGKTLLELGRVSNLPTVFSNVLCGAALSGAPLLPVPLALAVVAGALFYVGGMLLNDAFDAKIDAKERPERPIPSGRATLRSVFVWGFGMLAAGIALLAVTALAGLSVSGVVLPALGAVIAALVVLYDRFHKGLSWSPVVMGLCRAGLYALGLSTVAQTADAGFVLALLTLLLYVVGLTHIARFENASTVGQAWPAVLVFTPVALALAQPIVRVQAGTPTLVLALVSIAWSVRALGLARRGGRNIGRAVVALIAGISLIDAVFAASRNALPLAALCVGCWGLTLLGQRAIRGT